MNRNAKVQRKRVKALTDPQPQFVSLVTAGANMTPFTVVRSDGAEGPATAADVVATAKGDTHQIAHLVFDKNTYGTVDAVKSWLADGGYEDGTEITETENTFEVGEKSENTTSVEYEGVTIYLTELPDDAEVDAVETHPTVIEAKAEGDEAGEADAAAEEAPAAEDAAEAEDAEKTDAAEAAEGAEAAEAEQAEAGEAADEGAGGAVVADEVVAKSMYAVPELIGLVASLRWIVSDLSYENKGDDGAEGNYTAVIDSLKTSANSMLTGLSTLFAIEMGEMADKFKADEPAPETDDASEEPADAAPADAEKADDAAGDDGDAVQPVANSEADEAGEADAETAEKADVPAEAPADDLRDVVMSLAKSVGELTNAVAELHVQMQAKSEDLAERVEAIESEAQSRKGADVDEVVSSNSTPRKKSGVSDLAFNAALGIRRNAL